MPIPPRRAREAARLKSLQSLEVLDTPPHEFSDSIALQAASIANTPIAALSLVDETRQWFKASCGLSVRETPRDIAFCAHAILDSVAFIVPDTLVDERFRSNPLVVGEPYIRFYAGFPLVVNRLPIGTLCVIDDRPRDLSAVLVARLQALAHGAAAWLALRAHRA